MRVLGHFGYDATMNIPSLDQPFSRNGVLDAFRAFFPEQSHLSDPVQMRHVLEQHLAKVRPGMSPHWDRTDFEQALCARLHAELARVVAH